MINDESQLYCLIRRLRYSPIIFDYQIINVLENTVGNLEYIVILHGIRDIGFQAKAYTFVYQ